MNQIESLEPDVFKRTILLKELLLNIFGTSYIFFNFHFNLQTYLKFYELQSLHKTQKIVLRLFNSKL